jgi:diguanylate cyclase (GGDEF)-like protein
MKIFTNQNVKINMPVKKFMTHKPFTVTLSDYVKGIIDLMVCNEIGSAIVIDNKGVPVSILTKTDIMKLILYECKNISISETIKLLKKENTGLITVQKDTPISQCLEIFVSKNIKHLPVVDRDKKLIGIISATDIIKKFSMLIFVDSLTGFGNRYYLESIRRRIVRYKKRAPVGILMMDLDNFKNLNDTYGHTFGDEVLRKVAEIISNNIRLVDDVIRYGGEEFLVILSRASEIVTIKIAERIRKTLESTIFKEHPDLKVTISIGATLCNSRTGFEDCIELADKALREAKENGKNRVVFAPLI